MILGFSERDVYDRKDVTLVITAKDVLYILQESNDNIDTESLDHDRDLTEQGVDSLDMTSVLFAIEERCSISISEEDIASDKLSTINKLVQFANAQPE